MDYRFVSQSDREQAKHDAKNLINHQIQSLAGRTQQTVGLYTGLYLAWKENEPKPEAAQVEKRSANDVVLDTVSETLRTGVIANADDIPF